MNFLTGDFRYFWSENIINFAQIPSSWDASLNTGIGKSALSSLWINSYLNFTEMFNIFGLSWELISLIFWILPSIIISFLSSFLLFSYLFKKDIKYSLLSGIIYTLNTYFLMVLTGGQLGVALSYSLVPLVFLGFVKVIGDCRLRNSIIAGVILALQILFDPRLTFITLLAVGLYWLFNRKNIIFVFLIPCLVAALLHSYWLLPLFLTKMSPIPADFDSLAGFEFFSFADFSHALSFLHPNWPENIFGKTYFLKPEFIMLPILAYSSLFFIKNSKFDPRLNRGRNPKQFQNSKYKIQNNLAIEQFSNRTILFFSMLGLLGAFLAKGANEPFSAVNVWMFEHIPGFAMFRDPTKFYILTALTYSVLIPFSVYSIYDWFNSKLQLKTQKFLANFFLIFSFCYFLFLAAPVFLGSTFKTREVPKEYIQLKYFLHNKPGFFRTLWIPQWQRYGYFSNLHPAIGREEIFKGNAKEQIDQLKNPNTERVLRDLSVKYIVVPYDSEGEIFLKDRKYDEKAYREAVLGFEDIPWLKRTQTFGKIVVFEVPKPKDHFFLELESGIMNQESGVTYKMINPTRYEVTLREVKRRDKIIFSESYDKYWQARIHNSSFIIPNSRYNGRFNSFVLPKDGDYDLDIYYEPQKWVNIGFVISGVTFVLIGLVIGFSLRKVVKYRHD